MNNVVAERRSLLLLAAVGLFLVAGLSVGPDTPPVDFIPAFPLLVARWGSKAVVVLVMALAIVLRARGDRPHEPRAALITVALVLISGLMTGWHWYWRDPVEV